LACAENPGQRRRSIAALLVVASGALTVVAAAVGQSSRARLIVLHTSDLSGRVHPHDPLADRDLGRGLARISTAVKGIRAEGPALLVDSGDTINGSPTQLLAFDRIVGDGRDPMVKAMNALRYDAMAIGNHEFDFGLERLETSRREARFPWLAANVERQDGAPAFDPYIVREIGGVRVGILGLVTPQVPYWLGPRVAALRFRDTVETSRRFVPVLRGRERCDVVIVLTHEGIDRGDEPPPGGLAENQAGRIAREVPGIDLVLTGHTHTNIAPRREGSAWISQPGGYGETLTRFDLTLERRGAAWRVADVAGRNLPMKGVAPDPELVALIETEHRQTMEKLSEFLARVDRPVSAEGARNEDTGILDWLHGVQVREGKADLSFASLLPSTLRPWEKEVTTRDVWVFYPYENSLVTLRATGKQVRAALERAARCVDGVTFESGVPAWKRNPAIWNYNCDTMEGAEYALDPTKPEGERVLFLRRNGRTVRDEEVFRVAVNSYRASGGGGYFVWRDCPRLLESSRGLREILIEDARRRRALSLAPTRNWFLAPGLPEARFRPPA
jgi:2',3'-cyclic-nucleotide 2'-phosphodiesterase (5'-nucleotidase family)